MPGYMVREELQRGKIRERADLKAWGFDKRLRKDKDGELARKYLKGMRERFREGGGAGSRLEKKRRKFFKGRGKRIKG